MYRAGWEGVLMTELTLLGVLGYRLEDGVCKSWCRLFG